jgi:hypothetical protein
MIWTHSEIRNARRKPLRPVLEALGYELEAREGNNYRVINMPGKVIIKENYWVNHEENTAGNTIDFFVQLRGKSFSQTMVLLAEAKEREPERS